MALFKNLNKLAGAGPGNKSDVSINNSAVVAMVAQAGRSDRASVLASDLGRRVLGQQRVAADGVTRRGHAWSNRGRARGARYAGVRGEQSILRQAGRRPDCARAGNDVANGDADQAGRLRRAAD